MNNNNLYELINEARQGHDESVGELITLCQPRLRSYIFRVTLDNTLSDDLTQETFLEMVKALKNLRKTESFWPWLYSIAQNKISSHFRKEKKQSMVSISDIFDRHQAYHPSYKDDIPKRLQEKELMVKVLSAMKTLKKEHRAVISLRCFDQLPYSDIAMSMNCTEISARVAFHRAKTALIRSLKRQGVNPSLMLMSLGMFKKITSSVDSVAVEAVPAATIDVGFLTSAISNIVTKVGLMAITTAVTVVSVTGISLNNHQETMLPKREQIKSLHYTMQSGKTFRLLVSSLSKGAYEQWYYFPEGVDGPMFMKMQRWNSKKTQKQCSWLQNEIGNFYYHAGEKKVYINNYHLWYSNGRVRRLPSDTPELSAFLDEMEGPLQGIQWTRDARTKLITHAVDSRFADARNYKTTFEYNTCSEKDFTFFWPDNPQFIDQRDQMHKRGWTWFTIEGKLGEQTISGKGCIPFTYSASKDHPAWLKLNIGERWTLVDLPEQAYLSSFAQGGSRAYPSGTFFKGLARPWMGMHVMDTLRRDAAAKSQPFKTSGGTSTDLTINVYDKDKNQLLYHVNYMDDLLCRVEFLNRLGSSKGYLKFTYLQEIPESNHGFTRPHTQSDLKKEDSWESDTLWLFDLFQNHIQ